MKQQLTELVPNKVRLHLEIVAFYFAVDLFASKIEIPQTPNFLLHSKRWLALSIYGPNLRKLESGLWHCNPRPCQDAGADPNTTEWLDLYAR
eukprot:4322655-Amphidinium_carterae.1